MTMEPCPSETGSAGNGTEDEEGRGVPAFTLPIVAVAMMFLLAIVNRRKD